MSNEILFSDKILQKIFQRITQYIVSFDLNALLDLYLFPLSLVPLIFAIAEILALSDRKMSIHMLQIFRDSNEHESGFVGLYGRQLDLLDFVCSKTSIMYRSQLSDRFLLHENTMPQHTISIKSFYKMFQLSKHYHVINVYIFQIKNDIKQTHAIVSQNLSP